MIVLLGSDMDTQPNTTATLAAAYRARNAKRLALKAARKTNPAHMAAVARRLESAHVAMMDMVSVDLVTVDAINRVW